MCIVTLSYNENNKEATRQLAALLSTGLFMQVDRQGSQDIDFSEPSLFEIDPSLPEIADDLSPEQLERLIVEDIHSIYAAKHAV